MMTVNFIHRSIFCAEIRLQVMQRRKLSEIFSNFIFFIKILYSLVVEQQGLTAMIRPFRRRYLVCPLYEPTL
jgi:hypothetical protein